MSRRASTRTAFQWPVTTFFGGNTWQIAQPAANKLPPFLQQCRAGLPAKSCTVICYIHQQVGGSPPPHTEQRKRRKSLWIILDNYFDFSDISVGLFRGSSVVLMLSWFISLALALEWVFMSSLDRLSKPSMLESVFKKCDSVPNIFVPF